MSGECLTNDYTLLMREECGTNRGTSRCDHELTVIRQPELQTSLSLEIECLEKHCNNTKGRFFLVSRRFASRIHEISDLKKLSCSVLGPDTRG